MTRSLQHKASHTTKAHEQSREKGEGKVFSVFSLMQFPAILVRGFFYPVIAIVFVFFPLIVELFECLIVEKIVSLAIF
jgi:hypothetical protein